VGTGCRFGFWARLSTPTPTECYFGMRALGALKWLTVSTGLALSDTSLALSHLGLQSLTDPGADRVLFWDDSAGALKWLTVDGIVGTALGQWTSFTPTYYGWTSGTVTGTFKYSVIGNIVFLLIDMTAGTSNATYARINLPVNADLNASYGGALGMAMDNGTVLSGAAKWYIGGTYQEIVFGSDMGSGLWTASGSKRVRCLAIYAKVT